MDRRGDRTILTKKGEKALSQEEKGGWWLMARGFGVPVGLARQHGGAGFWGCCCVAHPLRPLQPWQCSPLMLALLLGEENKEGRS